MTAKRSVYYKRKQDFRLFGVEVTPTLGLQVKRIGELTTCGHSSARADLQLTAEKQPLSETIERNVLAVTY